MPKKKLDKIPVITFIVLILLSVLVFSVINMIDHSNYLEANVLKVSGTTIILGNNCTAIIAETSPERAESIELGMQGIIQERPNTHDTLVEILKSFNITLESVSIDKFDGKNYYANLLLKSGDKTLKLDTRPSDAIAIALRANTTIYLNKTLLQEYGKNICQ